MKMRVTIDIDCSKSVAATIQRAGFVLCPDGSGMQVKVQNAPPIPKRKTKIAFVELKEPESVEAVDTTVPDAVT